MPTRHSSSLCVALLLLAAAAAWPATAGSRKARENLAWMFTFTVKCPGVRPDFAVLERFIRREKVDFTTDSAEMVAIRGIGFRQQALLKGMSRTKICAMARARLGPNGTEVRGLLR